jgi:hypothetical protein
MFHLLHFQPGDGCQNLPRFPVDLLAHSPQIAGIVIGELQINGLGQFDFPRPDEVSNILGEVDCLERNGQAEPMGKLAGESPVAVGATGDQGRDTLMGDVINQLSAIFPGFLLEAGEQKGYTTASVNTHGLIGNPRFTEENLQRGTELIEEEDGTSEKKANHNPSLPADLGIIFTL